MTKQNFLLGRGEQLTQNIIGKSGGGPKEAPYTFLEARSRLSTMLSKAVHSIEDLPQEACPRDQAIVSFTLNPEYIAKSYFPSELFRNLGVEIVGSRPRKVVPEKRSKDRPVKEVLTTQLFAKGDRASFRDWNSQLSNWTGSRPADKEIVAIEQIAAPSASEKIKGQIQSEGTRTLEVVLHASQNELVSEYIQSFVAFLESLEISSRLGRSFYASGLCFLELDAPAERSNEIATYSMVRALREMPRLRMLRPTIRSSSIPSKTVVLPSEVPVAAEVRVAVFDGGIPAGHPLTKWVTTYDAGDVKEPHPEYLSHGVAVTSALLFGHIDPKVALERPYASVDHYRVLDKEPVKNPHELYEVLQRIDSVLKNKHYDFINLSLGPRLPVEDDDVHAWTAVLDDRFSGNSTLAAIAVGNDGEGDVGLRLNRIQVPADCVNALAVGACDTPGTGWRRAVYSSVGPGRSPGRMKPDLVEFGGAIDRPFLVFGPEKSATLTATGGTSFAAPSVLRSAIGVRAHFGAGLSGLAIRALLVHTAEESSHAREEVGWGRLVRTLNEIVLCDDDTVRVVYQGKISPAKYLRAAIPLPTGEIAGFATIKATLCYKSLVDSHHPGNYTRAGLEPTFRPHDGKFTREDQLYPDTKNFFGMSAAGATEDELRRDAWKWENCLHASKRMRGSSLLNPCFDIHYNARLDGHNFTPKDELPYALVVTVHAKNVRDLYDQVVRKYSTQLKPLKPTVEIPIRP